MELLLVTPPVRSMLSNSLKHANVIQSLTFLYGGQRIIAHHHDRSFTLFELRPSEPLKSCPIKVKRLPEIQNSVEVIAIGYDDSMFAIRQDHILSFYLITESMESIEAIHTLTLSLLTQMWPLNQSTKIDLREEDMTSRARVSRYLEINKPLSISPSRVLITRAITGSLYITILGNIGSPVSAQSNQCVLASSFDISSAIRNSQTELYLHTCYSVGLVLSSAANNGYLAILDVDNILHVINTSILQPKLDYLIEELSSLAKSTLPSHQEDLDIWENVKFIRQSLFVAQEVYFHQELLKSCVGSFQMTKNSQDILKYALHVSPKYLVEEKEKVSIFISRSERGNSTGQSIYEVIV